jgi:predicted small secreted protein
MMCRVNFQSVVARVLSFLVLTSLAGWLAGCNTTAGLGEDLEAAGSGLERAAERNKSY